MITFVVISVLFIIPVIIVTFTYRSSIKYSKY